MYSSVVERSTADRQVGGSNPPAPSTFSSRGANFSAIRDPLVDSRSLLPSVAWRSSIGLNPSPSKSGDIGLNPSPSKSGDRAEGARCWIVERAEGRVVSAYLARVTVEGATSDVS